MFCYVILLGNDKLSGFLINIMSDTWGDLLSLSYIIPLFTLVLWSQVISKFIDFLTDFS